MTPILQRAGLSPGPGHTPSSSTSAGGCGWDWRYGVTLCGVLGAALAAYFGVRMRHKNALLFALLCLAGSLFTAYPILHSAAALPPRPWYALEISVGYAWWCWW